MKKDRCIFSLIDQEKNRQYKGIELIASENFVSSQILEAVGSVLTNKYAEGYPGKRYYGGCQVVDEVEQMAIDRLKELFCAEWVNVQPHSGAQANMTVFLACLKPGDRFLGLSLSHGGHLSHGSSVNFSGLSYQALEYGTDKTNGQINYQQLEAIAKEKNPKLIIAGASAHSREWDYQRILRISEQVGAIFMVDMAHPAGLIAAKLLDNPLRYAHIVTSTTHKTLRGPRGGIILMGKDFENPWGKTNSKKQIKMMSELLDSTLFPGVQGGPLEHVIAAKAIAFYEALQPEYICYQQQVKKNAQALAGAFVSKGYKLVSGGTDNHLVLIDLRSKFPSLSGKQAEIALVQADITTNKNMIPFDNRSPFLTSGLRIGTPAITTRGVKEPLMEEIVEMIDMVLSNVENEAIIRSVKEKVNYLMKDYPLFAW